MISARIAATAPVGSLLKGSAPAKPKRIFSAENPPDGAVWRYALRYQISTPPECDIDEMCALEWGNLSSVLRTRILEAINA